MRRVRQRRINFGRPRVIRRARVLKGVKEFRIPKGYWIAL